MNAVVAAGTPQDLWIRVEQEAAVNNADKTGTNPYKVTSLQKRIGKLSTLLLFFYLCIIVYFVLFSDSLGRTIGYHDYQYNLTPFREIQRFIIYRDSFSLPMFILNLLGNLMILAPLGFLLPLIRMKKTGPGRILINAGLISLSVELLQLVTKVGVFDVDDLILNTVGSLIGYAIYRLARPFVYQHYQYLEESNHASD